MAPLFFLSVLSFDDKVYVIGFQPDCRVWTWLLLNMIFSSFIKEHTNLASEFVVKEAGVSAFTIKKLPYFTIVQQLGASCGSFPSPKCLRAAEYFRMNSKIFHCHFFFASN